MNLFLMKNLNLNKYFNLSGRHFHSLRADASRWGYENAYYSYNWWTSKLIPSTLAIQTLLEIV